MSAQDASALAAGTGEPVEVVSERTEYSRTEANPDGTFTLTQSTTPQRVRAKDGSWRDVDLTLERRADGTVGPRASVVDLSFSAGGSGTGMIRMAAVEGSVTLGWPGQLPKPTLEGPTATYPEVFQGVDLQLTATSEGYREVLVVKTAEAAANPQLNEVELTTSSAGLTLAASGGGGLRAFDGDGNTVFNGPAGLMWDSAGDAGVQTQLLTGSAVSASDEPAEGEVPQSQSPDKGDATAVLPVQVTDGEIAVKPDVEVLRGADTVYPVYIDPSMGLTVSERTVLSSDGDSFWNFSGDYGVGNCSRLGPWYCGSDYTNRMYFEFSPTKLAGKYVIDATFRAYETWSFSCSPQWVDLWRTNNISSATTWPGPSQLDLMGDRQVSAGRGDNCSPSQPDSWIEFNDNPAETDENLTKTVRSFADGNFSRLTLMLRAKDENDPDAWKRFKENADLQVVYVLKPGYPVNVGAIPGYGAEAHCSVDGNNPDVATRVDPTLQGRVRTLYPPATDAEKGSLRAHFYVQKKTSSGFVDHWQVNEPTSGYDVNGDLEKVSLASGADGTVYRFKVLTQSFWTYEGVTTAISSGYSHWCYFKIDLDAPKAPVIEPGAPYNASCADTGCGEPGTAGTFTFKPNPEDAADTTDPDITGYRWSLSTQAGAHVVGSSDANGDVVTISNVIPPVAGTTVLSVAAKDVRERYGPVSTFTFKVDQPDGAVGRWHFNDGTDSATEGTTRHAMELHQQAGKAATWSGEGRRGEGDHSLRLNDDVTDPAQQIGYASTQGGAPVDTAKSFTISAWVMLTDTTKTRVAASAPGTYSSAAFNLFYSSTAKKWVFNKAVADSSTPAYVSAVADTPNPPTGVWTHLAGVFDTKGDQDKTNDTIQLFVNGRPQGPATGVGLSSVNAAYAPWTSTQDMRVGASKAGEYFMGSVDELAVWQRAQSRPLISEEAELTENSEPATTLVASWDAAAATGTAVKDTSPYRKAALTPAGGAALQAGQGIVLNGTTAYATTTGPVVDETGSFTVSARVSLDEMNLGTKPVGYQAQVAGQRAGGESSWALWVVKFAEGDYQWKFTRTAVDGAGQVVQSAQVAPLSEGADPSGADVTGVFDAQESWEWVHPTNPQLNETRYGKLHLYVGSSPMHDGDGKDTFTAAQQGSGELAVGRGTTAGATGHYLPGALQKLRVWTGAMSWAQVLNQIPDSGV
ncbi:LamG-like jellyroll fold domain-containing protein [Streptomyces sp. NPDC014995]|uniref:LamG-like jellyroll fold domain-containing protein n=1 Tax=Streptomyces sp. NPDC014995 TaxID=3364936 RepID=UPI0036FA0D54